MGEEERRKRTVAREKAVKRERVIAREKDRDRHKHTETDIDRQTWTDLWTDRHGQTNRQTYRQIERQNKDYYQSTSDCHSPPQHECVKPAGVIPQKNRLEGVEETKVETDKDTYRQRYKHTDK